MGGFQCCSEGKTINEFQVQEKLANQNFAFPRAGSLDDSQTLELFSQNWAIKQNKVDRNDPRIHHALIHQRNLRLSLKDRIRRRHTRKESAQQSALELARLQQQQQFQVVSLNINSTSVGKNESPSLSHLRVDTQANSLTRKPSAMSISRKVSGLMLRKPTASVLLPNTAGAQQQDGAHPLLKLHILKKQENIVSKETETSPIAESDRKFSNFLTQLHQHVQTKTKTALAELGASIRDHKPAADNIIGKTISNIHTAASSIDFSNSANVNTRRKAVMHDLGFVQDLFKFQNKGENSDCKNEIQKDKFEGEIGGCKEQDNN